MSYEIILFCHYVLCSDRADLKMLFLSFHHVVQPCLVYYCRSAYASVHISHCRILQLVFLNHIPQRVDISFWSGLPHVDSVPLWLQRRDCLRLSDSHIEYSVLYFVSL